MRISCLYCLSLFAIAIYGCGTAAVQQLSGPLERGRVDWDNDQEMVLLENVPGLGSKAHTLELQLFRGGQILQSTDAMLGSEEAGHSFSLETDGAHKRAWVLDNTTQEAVLSADFAAQTYWQTSSVQPAWAKNE